MAVLGVQLVVTMVMASVLSKISSHFSIAKWMICNRLIRYLHPTDEELRTLGNIPKPQKGKGKKGRDRGLQPESGSSFMLPKNLELNLDSAVVQPLDVMQLRFYPEYQWLVDFAVCAATVYLLTELYYFISGAGKEEVNLSMLWCLLVIGFSIKVLFSLTVLYFRGEESIGERSLCLTSGFFFFVLAMVVLVADENMLEFGLDTAYASFNSSAHMFLENQGLKSSGPTSQLMFKFSLAVWCGLVGAFFTFPGLRFARMHHDSLKYSEERLFFKVLLHLSFLSPLFAVLMWVKPVARDYFTQRAWPGMQGSLMSTDVFDTSRLLLILCIVGLRFLLMPLYLQSYLNMAPDRIIKLRKEAGRISNVELQQTVARVFYYLCVVALQYITPLLMCLYTTLLLKTLGGYSWVSFVSVNGESSSSASIQSQPMLEPVSLSMEDQDQDFPIFTTSQQFSLALGNLKRVFTPLLYRGLLSFMAWWLCAVWFATSAIGLVYHTYFK